MVQNDIDAMARRLLAKAKMNSGAYDGVLEYCESAILSGENTSEIWLMKAGAELGISLDSGDLRNCIVSYDTAKGLGASDDEVRRSVEECTRVERRNLALEMDSTGQESYMEMYSDLFCKEYEVLGKICGPEYGKREPREDWSFCMKRAMPELGKNWKPRYKHIPYSVEREFMDAVGWAPDVKGCLSEIAEAVFGKGVANLINTMDFTGGCTTFELLTVRDAGIKTMKRLCRVGNVPFEEVMGSICRKEMDLVKEDLEKLPKVTEHYRNVAKPVPARSVMAEGCCPEMRKEASDAIAAVADDINARRSKVSGIFSKDTDAIGEMGYEMLRIAIESIQRIF